MAIYFHSFNFLQKICTLTKTFDSAASNKDQGQPSYFSWPPIKAELSILILRRLGEILESDC